MTMTRTETAAPNAFDRWMETTGHVPEWLIPAPPVEAVPSFILRRLASV